MCGMAAAKNACALLSGADVQAVIGEAVGKAQNRTVSQGAGNVAEVSICSYLTAGQASKTISLLARYSPAPNEDAGLIAKKLQKTGYKDVREIAGVGDRAIWAMTLVSHRIAGQLTVLRGAKILFVVTVLGFPDEAGSLEKAKALALRVLAKS